MMNETRNMFKNIHAAGYPFVFSSGYDPVPMEQLSTESFHAGRSFVTNIISAESG